MIKIALFCAGGMSTSILVKKIREAADQKKIEVDVEAYPESTLNKRLEEGIDVALLGPQVRFKLSQLKAMCETKGVPIDVINVADYGRMNGEKVLDAALKLVEDNKTKKLEP
ncbi:PTS system cellobiose-specific IIB component [Clostridium saccharoperbutylacetonicum]|uniref:Cellobiose-specific phosphotransferase enzyme IIB component CelA n=1 Tax=Clostridium saccharoperbutylacetonicum N1-4(HMT) TaxID=931276 RepID=M1MQK2_9CLOT|nr:PTS sugar transporter subunit IIB [Clostridium saccharoperbutylacetonicum]AGF57026.1 cellobiose-specific phosphotransferase enzyme IIB component CelA [Clostridium saccharoperbutylacetonicum N1-4(HMT)]NRT62215.1 PTS system cellobiose-specific IIB component [Clostridium saccharoperbutylacetonicum]NSB25546.1 PTS system cellobiose-specific IIB component [Clostridium saccharoperbutylacetonicum]NSB44916.1 PTS system cellobiose-specific IIB component [Clostridium saccharoperbutylacetonicum]